MKKYKQKDSEISDCTTVDIITSEVFSLIGEKEKTDQMIEYERNWQKNFEENRMFFWQKPKTEYKQKQLEENEKIAYARKTQSEKLAKENATQWKIFIEETKEEETKQRKKEEEIEKGFKIIAEIEAKNTDEIRKERKERLLLLDNYKLKLDLKLDIKIFLEEKAIFLPSTKICNISAQSIQTGQTDSFIKLGKSLDILITVITKKINSSDPTFFMISSMLIGDVIIVVLLCSCR